MGLDTGIQLMAKSLVPVDVVIPVFNNSKTIIRALNSVINQSVAPHKIIIIDDASTDETLSLIYDWSKEFSNVEILQNKLNLGPSATRNRGWDAATSDLIAFLDADDSWHTEKLRIQHGFMTANPNCVISAHKYQVVKTQLALSSFSGESMNIREFKLRDFLIKNRFSTPTVMLKRIISERFEITQRFAEDYLLWLTIIAKYGSGQFLELPLTYLHKEAYGDGGISGDLTLMYLGELQTLKVLLEKDVVTRSTSIVCKSWVTIKFARRFLNHFLRKLRRK